MVTNLRPIFALSLNACIILNQIHVKYLKSFENDVFMKKNSCIHLQNNKLHYPIG